MITMTQQRSGWIRTTAVDHDRRVVIWASCFDDVGGGLDMLRRIIWAIGSTSENDVHVLVASCFDDRCESLDSVVNSNKGQPMKIQLTCSVTPINA